jgi:1-acyl-sn-glycerol-3-phosphate acyltransferase
MCILEWLLVPVLKLYVKEAKGFENITSGPGIIIANHSSYIDPVLVRYFVDWHCRKAPKGIQSREWVEKSWLRKFIFLTVLKQIPTNGSVEKALEALTRGETLMLFPEGARSQTGKIQKTTHTGLGVLASETHLPVIPIGIKGTFEWWPRQNFLPKLYKFKCIKLKAGKPLFYSGANDKKSYIAFQNKAMKEVAKLAK